MIQTDRKLITLFPLNPFTASEGNVRQRSKTHDTPLEVVPITMNLDRINTAIVAMAITLLAASTVFQLVDEVAGTNVLLHKLARLFSVDRELNAPAFFSMLLLLFTTLLLTVVTLVKKQKKAPFVLHWAALSFGFLFMAFDEIVAVHERLIEPMRYLLGENDLGVLYFAWVVPGIALVLFLAFFFLKFWWNLPGKIRLQFLIAGSLYLGGAIGMELIDGSHAEIHGKENLTYVLLSTFEEGLEMAGIIVFIRGLLSYIADLSGILQFQFSDPTR